MKTRIYVEKELQNIAPRFRAAIWRERRVNRYYESVKEASNFHNLCNCKYHHLNSDGDIAETFNNARLDSYGRRFN